MKIKFGFCLFVCENPINVQMLSHDPMAGWTEFKIVNFNFVFRNPLFSKKRDFNILISGFKETSFINSTFFFFQLPLIIVICIVFFCIWISISIFIKNYNLCLSNHNLEIPGPICLKFGLGNSGDPQECFSLVLVF